MQKIQNETKKRIKFILDPLFKLPLLNISLSFSFGVVLGVLVGVKSALLIICVIVFIIFSQCRKRYLYVFITSLFLLLGLFRYQYYNYQVSSHSHISSFIGKEVKLSGKVVWIGNTGKKGDKMRLSKINIISEDLHNDVSTSRDDTLISGDILLGRVNTDDDINLGDNVLTYGMLSEPPRGDGFDYRSYLESKGIYSTVDRVDILDVWKGDQNLSYYFRNAKQEVTSSISKLLPEPHSLLLSGIVYGDLGNISESFEDDLQVTGTTHIVAVSGYNVTVLVASFAPLMTLFGRRVINIFTIVFVTLFMLFVGTDNVPVVRAGVMGIVLLFANLLGRKRGVIVFLAFTVAIFLLLKPLMFKQLSFQLSFLSTIGLIFLSDSITEKLKFIPEAFREDVASTFSAIFSTTPVTLPNFNQISIIAPVANFFVLPIIPIITVGGFLFIFLALVLPGLARIFAYFFWLFLEYMVKVIEFFGSFNFAMLKVNSTTSNLVSTLLVVLLLGFVAELNYKKSINEH
jgi:competence protein ComEC